MIRPIALARSIPKVQPRIAFFSEYDARCIDKGYFGLGFPGGLI
jgi:hypothetical protein